MWVTPLTGWDNRMKMVAQTCLQFTPAVFWEETFKCNIGKVQVKGMSYAWEIEMVSKLDQNLFNKT